MRSNYFWTANRMIWAWIAGTFVVVGGLCAAAAALSVPTIAALAVPVLVVPVAVAAVLVLLRTLARQVARVAKHASAQRPGAVVCPAAAFVSNRADREALGLQMAEPNTVRPCARRARAIGSPA